MPITTDPELQALREQTAATVQKAQVELENYRIFREIKDTERNHKLLDTFSARDRNTHLRRV